MVEMVEGRRHADQVERRYDLFSGLLDATQDEPGSEAALDDDELIGEYIKLRSFSILGRMSWSYSSSQETCLYFFLLDMR